MEPVTLKGNREGVVVQLNCNLDFEELCEKIEAKIKSADSFLGNNTEVIINLGSLVLNEEQTERLRNLFKSWELGIKKFIPDTVEQEGMGKMVLPNIIEDDNHFLAEGSTLVVRRNLRSGQAIFHEGTVIIFGDVNPGAEVIASGHIFVMGHLRGIAHAGAHGDVRALVYASRLQPTQLRIANFITRAPDEEVILPSEPEIARIKDDIIVLEKYLQK
ncbi:MAG: septum site-determining protein MinC [Peptococcales bacterium]|jgi:septum site-determining protein MinC